MNTNKIFFNTFKKNGIYFEINQDSQIEKELPICNEYIWCQLFLADSKNLVDYKNQKNIF